ncbi:AraC family transcriptional regulator [Prescottella agglutinans]|uniref:AraC-like DNA-binding protein n=1 Tax=Prescottella agglutinans TaxID=1644129 RepID=A0ABT6MDW6_9NOCA|nr:AraC family transcriptional regulator [Prescottella agglutinans]MDH6282487.1 AraC-like DNA-binding protein [Prescottella agglutinans]
MSTPTDTGREQTGDHPYPNDWEEVSHAAAAYFPHQLTPLASAGPESVTLENIGIGPVRIARIDWGSDAEVCVRSEHPGAFAVNIPLSGRLDSVTGRHEISSAPGTATICPPDVLTTFPHWSGSCAILGVRFDRAHLEREMSRALGRPGARLPMQLDLSTPVGASWLRFVRSMSEQMRDPYSVVQNDLVSAQLLSAATTGFVLAAVPEDVPGASEARPRIVKRVIDAIHDDPAHDWTVLEMAERAGVGVRRLQDGFRRYVGRSPTEYLADVRLGRVRQDLAAAGPGDTVGTIALRWGFAHTGRFAAAYRNRFGTIPSAALRSA